MDTLQFLETVLSDNGRYYMVTVKHIDNKAIDSALTQTPYLTIEELATRASEADAKGLDAYFALGTFGDANNRKAINVLEMKAFFLDIDCGPEKDYPTKLEAFHALKAFCKKFKLPKPIIVDSGNGLHVYWPLTEAVTRDEWRPVAQRLKELCRTNDLHADEKVTADPARVLRVVGTHNHKREAIAVQVISRYEPTPISLNEFLAKLGGLGMSPVPNTLPAMTKDPLVEHYTKNFAASFKKIFMRSKDGDGCAQVLNRIATRSEATYDEWTEMLALAQQCSDRDKAIQIVSKGHPDYDPDGARNKAATFDGPTLCSTFERTTPGHCAGCPHQGKIKSPIILGKEIAVSEGDTEVVVEGTHLPAPTKVTIPEYPQGYERGKHGGVYMVIEDEDGGRELKVVCQYDIYVHTLMNTTKGDVAVIRVHLPHEGMREFHIPTEQITSKDELRKHLSRASLMVADSTKLMYYFMTWVNKWLLERKHLAAKEQFGWNQDNTEFVWGEWIYRKDEDPVPNMPTVPTAAFMAASRPAGSRERWQELLNFYNKDGMEAYQAMICMSLAAPLIKLSALHLGAVHFRTAKSGKGKTTTSMMGLSFWGKPNALMMEAKSTHNSHMHQMQTYKNILFVIDELTNLSGKQLSNMIYTASSGKQRSRLKQSANELRETGDPWHSLLITSGNDSVLDMINSYKALPDAEAQRMLEVSLPPIQGLNKVETDALFRDIQLHYGYGGPEFIQAIVDEIDVVKATLLRMQEKFDKAAKLGPENRFWSIVVASNLTALLIARKLGLLDYDVNKLSGWWLSEIEKAKVRVNDMLIGEDAQTVISRFWYDNLSRVVVLDGDEDSRGKNATENLIVPYIVPKGGLVGRYEKNTNTVFVSVSALKTWCTTEPNRISFTDLRDNVMSELGGKTKGIKKRLTKGTYYGGGSVYVWEIPADRLEMDILNAESSESRSGSA